MLHFTGIESKSSSVQLDRGEEMTPEMPHTNNLSLCTELHPKTQPDFAV